MSAERDETRASWRVGLLLLLLGATVGTALDGLHTWSGATWYERPLFWKSTWWVPPLFGGAGVAIGLGRRFVDALMGKTTPAPSMRAALVAMGVFFAAYAASGFLPLQTQVKAALLLTTFALLWWAIDRTVSGLVAAFGAALSGLCVEMTLVHFGAFHHRDADVNGVALWIPPLYATASVAVGGLTLRLLATSTRPAPVDEGAATEGTSR